MQEHKHFVIFKRNSCYSITECTDAGVLQAYIRDGSIQGDGQVLLRLAQVKPEGETIESFVEKNAGRLIYV